MIETFVSEIVIQSLGWTLLHFLWQGVLLGALAAAMLAALAQRSAAARYRIGCAAMGLMLLAPMTTFWLLLGDRVEQPQAVAVAAVARTEQAAVESSRQAERQIVWEQQVSRRVRPWLSWLSALWLCGVVVLSLRMIGGWRYAHGLKRRGTARINDELQRMLTDMIDRFALPRPAAILESAIVQAPIMIGWLRPVILLPASALTGLTPEYLRAIVAHELAHIRRRDYLANLLQFVVETLLFYHPAVWWLSQRIREERENCCDDIAVAVHGDALGYARALTQLESLRSGQPRLAMAATGGGLLNRVSRLVQEPARKSNSFGFWLAGLLALGAVFTTGLCLPLVSRFRDSQQELSIQYPAGSAEERAAKAMNQLIKTLKGRNFELKGETATALEQIRASGTIEPVLAALTDPSEFTREKAAWALGNLEDRRAVEPLIRSLSSGDWRGQHTVAWALGMIGDSEAVGALIESLKRGNQDARHGSAWALGKIGDKSAVDPLVVCLKDDAPDVRHGAAWALGMIGDPRAIEPLRAALENSDSDVREAINQALSKLSK